jgi:hypothetical protein
MVHTDTNLARERAARLHGVDGDDPQCGGGSVHLMSPARFDVNGRCRLEVEWRGDRSVAYELGEGKRRERPDIFIPPEAREEALALTSRTCCTRRAAPGWPFGPCEAGGREPLAGRPLHNTRGPRV